MKFSEKWLREWVNPAVDTEQLCEQLTMAGLEVDAVVPAAPDLAQVVVGRIEACEKHPDADALQLCQVNIGAVEPLHIVCGAPNAAKGLRVAVAQIGAQLPGGMKIKAAKIRGVASQGMLCSASELGLADENEGILSLGETAEPGQALVDYLKLDDQVIEIDLTPNRGDCLSLRGIAREVAVANRLPLHGPECAPQTVSIDQQQPVQIEATQACSSYAGRVITGLNPQAASPDWLRERLRRSGVRPISPVVDITNYVMLELGQPMHAFDAKRLRGNICVRFAAPGERITLLDETEISLESDALVIADDSGPIALAGIMGGAATAMQADSASVFLESASFSPSAMAGMGRRYKRHTDALHRYERGVDAGLQSLALERATALILDICGGQAGPVSVAGSPQPAAKAAIKLRHARVTRLLGSEIDAGEITDILGRLEMQVTEQGDTWQVVPPSFRFDIALEADLIEEIARVHGYNRLPTRAQHVPAAISAQPERQIEMQRLREVLLQRGYNEAVTYSFVDAPLQQKLNPDAAAVDVDNPIAEQYAQMRTTLWSSLLPAWQHNARRQQARVRLFEFGLRFRRDAQATLGIDQRLSCAGIISGSAEPEHWQGARREIDLFDAKGHVEALFAAAAPCALSFIAAQHPALHPGRSAKVLRDGVPVGWLGQLHPELKKQMGNRELPYVFELDCEAMLTGHVPRASEIPEFPWVRRDLAVVVPEVMTAGELVHAIWSQKPQYLQSVNVFDIFRGQDLETGFKSIALGLIFQDKSSTLTDQGVDDAVAQLTDHLGGRLGAKVRGQ